MTSHTALLAGLERTTINGVRCGTINGREVNIMLLWYPLVIILSTPLCVLAGVKLAWVLIRVTDRLDQRLTQRSTR